MDRLKDKFRDRSQHLAGELKAFVRQHGGDLVDQVTVAQVYGGMRGVKGMLWETSSLDPDSGITFRGYSIDDLREKLPRAQGGTEPLPEGLFWLMLVGELPSEEDVAWLSGEWETRSTVPADTMRLLDCLPPDTHPMAQFTMAVMSLQRDSLFAQQYSEGLSKADFWDPCYEDSMNLIARLPAIAAYIYRRSFHGGHHIEADPSLDWGANYAHMLGGDSSDFYDFIRLYLTIHADHEGGNASAHTTHLVGSTLADAYLSFAAGMNALAGPLHGLANQEVIKWIFEMLEALGTESPSHDQIRAFVVKTLNEGKVIPGYGHAVLRKPDPRFMAQKRFAENALSDSSIVQVVWKVFEVVPEVLSSLGKVKNPWPNVDAHSGAILVHYGMKEFTYYTVMFGVSRALGVLAALCWSRALGLSLERPKSVTSAWLRQYVAVQGVKD